MGAALDAVVTTDALPAKMYSPLLSVGTAAIRSREIDGQSSV